MVVPYMASYWRVLIGAGTVLLVFLPLFLGHTFLMHHFRCILQVCPLAWQSASGNTTLDESSVNAVSQSLMCYCSVHRLRLKIIWISINTGMSFPPRSYLEQWEMPFFPVHWRTCLAGICTPMKCQMSLWRKSHRFRWVSFLLVKSLELLYKILFLSCALGSLIILDVLYLIWKLTHLENSVLISETFHFCCVAEQSNLICIQDERGHVNRGLKFPSQGFLCFLQFHSEIRPHPVPS
jgi:hypothetical protein